MAAPPPSSGYTGGAETSPALVVDSLRKSYSGREVVRGVSFTAERGEVTAVLGPNGAGKTTTVECCEGLRRPDSGRIEVLGHDRLADNNAFLNAHVGVMLQDLGLPMAPTAGRVLRHVARLHDRPRDIHELADRLGLTDRLGTPVRRLSGGQRQRVALACALIGQPSLVFLDEPTSGLDPHARRETWDLIRSLRHDGITVILTSHLMDEVDALADRVIVLDDGHVVATGSPGDLTGSYEVRVTPPDASTSALEDLADALRDSLETPVSVSGPDVVVSNEHAAAPDATTMARLSKSVLDEGHDDAIIRITSMTMEDAFLSLTTTGNGTEKG